METWAYPQREDGYLHPFSHVTRAGYQTEGRRRVEAPFQGGNLGMGLVWARFDSDRLLYKYVWRGVLWELQTPEGSTYYLPAAQQLLFPDTPPGQVACMLLEDWDDRVEADKVPTVPSEDHCLRYRW